MTVYVLDDDYVEAGLWRLAGESDPEVDVYAFTHPDSLIEAIKTKLPDVIVLDMVMPFANGLDVRESLKVSHPNIKVVFNTAKEGDEYRLLAESKDAVYLSKTDKLSNRLEVVKHHGRN